MLEEHGLWAGRLHTAILTYAIQANMTIVVRILNLPQELRDLIYSFLFEPYRGQDPKRNLLYWWECFDQPWFQIGEDIRDSPWLTTTITGIRPPHFIDRVFVGEQCAREILRLFRKIIGKDMRSEDKRNAIGEFALTDESAKDFMAKDVFGVGVTMQRLTDNLDLCVNFQCDSLDHDTDDVSSQRALDSRTQAASLTAESAESADRKQHLENLKIGVLSLCALPCSNRTIVLPQRIVRPRVVTILVRQECCSYKALVDILDLVKCLYRELKKKGFVLRVRYHSEEIGLKVLFEEDVWTWTEEDWRTNFPSRNTSRAFRSTNKFLQQRLVWDRFEKMVFADVDGASNHGDSGSKVSDDGLGDD